MRASLFANPALFITNDNDLITELIDRDLNSMETSSDNFVSNALKQSIK